jgi:hypothetical protein
LPRITAGRQQVIDYLTSKGPVSDRSGRATALLKEAVGYTHGDAGFSQLISAMEKAGQITREVRGKRTYRIEVTSEGATAAKIAPTVGLTTATATTLAANPVGPTLTGGDVDYDELAVALLAHTARVLAASQEPAETAGWARRRIEQLEARVDELQRDVARAKAEAQAVAEQRDEIRGHLEAASHNIEILQERVQGPRTGTGKAADKLGNDEQALLFALRGSRGRGQGGRAG